MSIIYKNLYTFRYDDTVSAILGSIMVCGMVAYAITRRGADKMLKVTEKIYVPADNWRTFSDFYSVGIIHC